MVHQGGNGPTSKYKFVQNATKDGLMQLIWTATPDVLNQTSMPQRNESGYITLAISGSPKRR